MPYLLTEAQRDRYRYRYREVSQRSQRRKRVLTAGIAASDLGDERWAGRLDPNDLTPSMAAHGLNALSLFTAGGGLDLRFERAG